MKKVKYLLFGIVALSFGLSLMFAQAPKLEVSAATLDSTRPAIIGTAVVDPNGRYDAGENYIDTNGNGRYDLGESWTDAPKNMSGVDFRITGSNGRPMALGLNNINLFFQDTNATRDEFLITIAPIRYYDLVAVNVVRGVYTSGNFTSNGSETITLTESGLGSGTYLFVLPSINIDYKFELHFAPLQYEVNVDTAYTNGTTYTKNPELGGYFEVENISRTTGDTLKVMLGDELRLMNSLSAADTTKRFAYPVIEYSTAGYYDNLGTRLTFEDAYSVTVDEEFIDSHVLNGEINIIGAYVRTYSFTVNGAIDNNTNVDSALFDDAIQTVVQSPIVFSPNGGNRQFSGENYIILDEGSTVTITTIEGDYIEYDGALTIPHTTTPINANGGITLNFTSKDLTLSIKAVDSDGNAITGINPLIAANFDSDRASGKIHILDVLESITYDGESLESSKIILGGHAYVFEGFKIKRAVPNASGDRLDDFTISNNGLAIDEDFLDTYFSNNKVEISATFRREFTLTVGQSEFGTIEITENVGDDEWVDVSDDNGKYYFGKDANIRITAKSKVNGVYQFSHFTNIATSEIDGNTASFSVGSDRSITAVFKTLGIKIATDDKVNFEGGETKFKVGDVITLEYDLNASSDIRDWKIGGKSYKDFGDDASLSGKTLSIRLSEELLAANQSWISSNGNIALINIENDIKTGLKLTILIPLIIVPLMLIGLLVMLLTNAKRNKLMKAELVSERTDKSKFDLSGYMQDLKSGRSVGQVSKEDIRAARKAQIEEAKRARNRDGGNK
ncbi:MAG: hypothetical protein LBM01_00485 [Christensenellaceae bacterium]|jgi:hypothetical protein|nr:hypothetical protein [Christensenellaceae bacterium]